MVADLSPPGKERRRAPRFESLNLVQCSITTADGQELGVLGRTLDMSLSGIMIEVAQSTAMLPSLPDRVKLTIAIEERMIEAEGNVVHQKFDGDVEVAGIEFSSMKPDDRRFIADFLERKNHPRA